MATPLNFVLEFLKILYIFSPCFRAKLEPQGHDEKIEKIVSSESEKMSTEQTI